MGLNETSARNGNILKKRLKGTETDMARAKYQVLVIPYKKTEDGVLYCVFKRSDIADCWQFIAGGGEDEDNGGNGNDFLLHRPPPPSLSCPSRM